MWAESDDDGAEDMAGLLDAVAEIEQEWFLARAVTIYEKEAANNEERTRRRMAALECNYCGRETRRVLGAELGLSGGVWANKVFFACPNEPCDAYVGCYSDGRPLGSTANAQLRNARKIAHAAFDPTWQSGRLSRDEAYCWLAKELNLPKHLTHMGMFSLDQCRRVVELCNAKQEN